jgi:hypothetical protein
MAGRFPVGSQQRAAATRCQSPSPAAGGTLAAGTNTLYLCTQLAPANTATDPPAPTSLRASPAAFLEVQVTFWNFAGDAVGTCADVDGAAPKPGFGKIIRYAMHWSYKRNAEGALGYRTLFGSTYAH